jgi:type IV secretory pathway VirB9-like protein
MLQKAVAEGLLSDLASRGFRQRTSMYADDVVIFLKPSRLDLDTCTTVVEDFGKASGLHTNRAK